MKSIYQILEFLDISFKPRKNSNILSIHLDSRKCNRDSVFIALKGKVTDGNKYIKEVISKGAQLVLTDNIDFQNCINIFYIGDIKAKLSVLAKWFYNYKKPRNIIGITGTNGKTSISNYIAQFLSLVEQKSLLLGTNGNGIYPQLKESSHTTLDILSLYNTISSCEGYQSLIMEVSSHSLDQKRVEGLDFDIAVFSNLSHDHLDYHHTMENYFKAKAKLFKFNSLKKAVINIDDKYGKELCKLCDCKVISVSLNSKEADIYIDTKNTENMRTIFDLYISQEHVGYYETYLIGEFNLMNLGLSLGVLDVQTKKEELLSNIAKIKPVKGRMEVIELNNDAKVIIDYAHTPDALEKALSILRKYSVTNLWCVFGCGGNRDSTKRSLMAAISEKYADKVVVTEDNNRFENVENIFSDISKGFSNPKQHVFIISREKAIKHCIENSNPKDLILLAGKGHECYLDKNGIKEYFDEREIIKVYGGGALT